MAVNDKQTTSNKTRQMATLLRLCVLGVFRFLERVRSHTFTQGCILHEYTDLKQDGEVVFLLSGKALGKP